MIVGDVIKNVIFQLLCLIIVFKFRFIIIYINGLCKKDIVGIDLNKFC